MGDSETEICKQKTIWGVFSATTANTGSVERQNMKWHAVATKTPVSAMGSLDIGRPYRAAFS